MLESNESTGDLGAEIEYYQTSLKDGYRGLAGALLGTALSEAILLLGGVGGQVPLLFAFVGLALSARHLVQIWQAKQQLKEQESSLSD